jgi:hypothetical protein
VGYTKEERHEQALNKRVLLEGFFTASTLTLGGHFMWQRVNQ